VLAELHGNDDDWKSRPTANEYHQEMIAEMTRRLLLLGLVLAFVVSTGHATTRVVEKKISSSRTLAGHVLVLGTNEPFNGATVGLYTPDWKTVLVSTKTDDKGYFSLEKTAPEKLFYIRVSAPGMDIYEFRVRIKKQATQELTVRLSVAE
jgi:hypothetical protein